MSCEGIDSRECQQRILLANDKHHGVPGAGAADQYLLLPLFALGHPYTPRSQAA